MCHNNVEEVMSLVPSPKMALNYSVLMRQVRPRYKNTIKSRGYPKTRPKFPKKGRKSCMAIDISIERKFEEDNMKIEGKNVNRIPQSLKIYKRRRNY